MKNVTIVLALLFLGLCSCSNEMYLDNPSSDISLDKYEQVEKDTNTYKVYYSDDGTEVEVYDKDTNLLLIRVNKMPTHMIVIVSLLLVILGMAIGYHW